jgi:uncharacterized SAM-binding protein YcdF (DUF218 family)
VKRADGSEDGVRAAVAAIGAFLFIRERPLRADATIVLGMTLWHRPVERAAALHRDGRSGLLVFTGGWNAAAGVVEAQAMAHAALDRGIPPAEILVEPEATNTDRNFRHVAALLRTAGMLTPGVRLNVVAIAYHLRRAMLTARAVFPPDATLGTVAYPSVHFGAGDWHRSAHGRRVVLGEIERIGRYFGPEAIAELQPHLGTLRTANWETPCVR